MARKKKCRDCKECRRRGISKLLRGTVRAGAAVSTLGATEIANKTQKALLADVCPICGHRMSLHEGKNEAVAE